MQPKSESLLAVDGVGHRFGGVQVLDDVRFSIAPGEIVGLIGPNGAGKTTLFNLVSGLLRLWKGSITLGETRIERMSAASRAKLGIGRTFQQPRLFEDLSVVENVAVGGLMRTRRPDVALSESGKWLERVGVGAHTNRPVSELTLLQRKFVELARAIAGSPRLLLLDEVMTGLNDSEIQSTITLVQELRNEGITVLLVEHVMQAVMNLSDRILVLSGGHIITDGPPALVVKDPRVLEVYLGSAESMERA